MVDQMNAGKTIGADQISDAAKAVNLNQEPTQQENKPTWKVNTLRLYFGDPYQITDDIIIRQPYIQDILDYGESEFYSMLYMFIGNTTFRKVFLWNNGIDWNKTSDYELFCNLVKMLSVEDTKVLFGEDIDFSGFNLYAIEDVEPEPEPDPNVQLTRTEKMRKKFREFERTRTFYNPESEIEINAETYHYLVAVLREMFITFPKAEYTHSKVAKELLIKEEHDKLKKAERDAGDSQQSTLLPLISFCVNHPGFKYRKDELRHVQIYEFMDSVRRLPIIESTRALLIGSMSGFCDTSKIPKSQFDFMRPINQP